MIATFLLSAVIPLAVLADAPAMNDAPPPAGSADAPPAESAETQASAAAKDAAALIEEVRNVAAKAASWRGATFAKKLGAVRATTAERRASALTTLSGWSTPQRLAARGRAWSDLGLGTEASPAELYGVLAHDLAGLAVTADGLQILIDPSRLNDEDYGPSEGADPAASLLMMTGVRPDEPVVAHLADHALDLQRAAASQPVTTDELLASRAWTEGRANLIACRLLFEGVGAADIVHSPSFDPAQVLEGALVPEEYATASPGIRSLLYFVYAEGFAQAGALAKSGGMAAVTRALATRTATSDVLHPDKAAVGTSVIEGPSIPVPPNFSLADRDVLGEQGIITLVSITTGKDNLALLTGEGWQADTLFRYEPSGDPRARGFTVWVSRWVSDAEAADFVYGFGRVLEAKFPGVPISDPAPGRRTLATADRVYRIDRTGATVSVRVATPREDEIIEIATAKRSPGQGAARPK